MDDLKTILKDYINSTESWDCPGFPELKCDPKVAHCPYSRFGEVECVPCESTCNPEWLTNPDQILDCLKQCPIYVYDKLGLYDDPESQTSDILVWILSTLCVLLMIFLAIVLYKIFVKGGQIKKGCTSWKRRRNISSTEEGNEDNQERERLNNLNNEENNKNNVRQTGRLILQPPIQATCELGNDTEGDADSNV